jgi:hypothetical protein
MLVPVLHVEVTGHVGHSAFTLVPLKRQVLQCIADLQDQQFPDPNFYFSQFRTVSDALEFNLAVNHHLQDFCHLVDWKAHQMTKLGSRAWGLEWLDSASLALALLL